jgi:dTDP-4-dehydrorhamnose 3,5-epimerase
MLFNYFGVAIMLKSVSSLIPGCYEIEPRVLSDERGYFVKIYTRDAFCELNLFDDFVEEFYTISRKGTIRGLHFQIPPHDHFKMVYCTHGEVFDVVLDLRRGSPTYGATAIFNLSATRGNYLYIPKGLAHGFCALTDNATLVYKVGSIYSPRHDTGVHPMSVNIEWPVKSPILSERDQSLIPFNCYVSPFVYQV